MNSRGGEYDSGLCCPKHPTLGRMVRNRITILPGDSTTAVRSATATETSASISSWYAEVGSDSEATRILLSVMNDPESVSREEALQFVYMIHGLMTQYQTAYYLSQEQTLDVQLRESLVNTIAGVREQPGFRMYWQQRRDLFDPDFRSFMDDLITNGTTNRNLEQIYSAPIAE